MRLSVGVTVRNGGAILSVWRPDAKVMRWFHSWFHALCMLESAPSCATDRQNVRKRSFDVLFRRALTPVRVSTTLLIALSALTFADEARESTAASLVTPYITVEADYFEVDLLEERAYFTGRVSATQGNNTFRTSQLTLHLEQIIGQADAGESNNSNQKKSAPYELHAAQLSYDLPNGLILGTGGSELRRGGERIQADQISYRVERRMAFGTAKPGERVLVHFIANPQMPIFPTTAAIGSAGD